MSIPASQIVGPEGDGAASNDEAVDPWFLIGSSAVWNGLALGGIDIAKRQTTRKKHVDVGLRVADYPTIQDYVGEAVMDTNACRLFGFSVAQAMDNATDHNTKRMAPGEFARANFLHWAWQIKFEAAKNTAHVVDKMLHACGGTGYKRDMEMERYLRDAKAGWVMGPTNEVLRQFVGKAVLLGFDSLDYWNQTYNRRAVENEIKKLDADGKRKLAEELMAQVEKASAPASGALPWPRSRHRASSSSTARSSATRSGPGGVTVVALGGDDELRIIDRYGGQVAELTAVGAPLGPPPDADATVLRARGVPVAGLDPSEARCVRLFGPDSAPGSELSFTAVGETTVDRRRARRAGDRRRRAGHRAGAGGAPRGAAPGGGGRAARRRWPSRGWTSASIRPSAQSYEVREGEYIQIIDVRGKQCSDFLAFARRQAAQPASSAGWTHGDPDADGQRLSAAGPVSQVL